MNEIAADVITKVTIRGCLLLPVLER